MMKPLERALTSLHGLWVGDAFGSHFEFDSVDWERPKRTAKSRILPPAIWTYSDDTQMALSVYETLRRFNQINSDKLAESFGKHFDISRGYGSSAEKLLSDIKDGGDWSVLAPAMFAGSGSYGNGAAMRVAPIGAYFADDIDKVIENATQSAVVTHTHPNGIAGAIAVAVGAAQAYQFAATKIKPDVETFWNVVHKSVPAGEVNNKLQITAELKPDTTTEQAAKILGCGWDVSAVDTVPFALWCAINYLDNFEEALWQTISVGGDADTTGAIVGGIIAAYGGISCIPQEWIQRCEPLPDWALADKDDS